MGFGRKNIMSYAVNNIRFGSAFRQPIYGPLCTILLIRCRKRLINRIMKLKGHFDLIRTLDSVFDPIQMFEAGRNVIECMVGPMFLRMRVYEVSIDISVVRDPKPFAQAVPSN